MSVTVAGATELFLSMSLELNTLLVDNVAVSLGDFTELTVMTISSVTPHIFTTCGTDESTAVARSSAEKER